MMVRRKARRRSGLIIGSAIVLTLAVLSGAVFFLLPKITAASVNQPMSSTRQASNTANTINSTTSTSNTNKTNQGSKVSNATNTGQIPSQPTQAPATTTKQSSNTGTMGNGNQAAAPAAPAQNMTVPIVTLKQYVPDIRHMVAQNFNLTDKALAQQLQNGMHLKDIAMQHGLSDMQLQNLLSTSITTGFQPAITAGSVTPVQVSTFIQQTQQNPTTLEQQMSILPAPVAHW